MVEHPRPAPSLSQSGNPSAKNLFPENLKAQISFLNGTHPIHGLPLTKQLRQTSPDRSISQRARAAILQEPAWGIDRPLRHGHRPEIPTFLCVGAHTTACLGMHVQHFKDIPSLFVYKLNVVPKELKDTRVLAGFPIRPLCSRYWQTKQLSGWSTFQIYSIHEGRSAQAKVRGRLDTTHPPQPMSTESSEDS